MKGEPNKYEWDTGAAQHVITFELLIHVGYSKLHNFWKD